MGNFMFYLFGFNLTNKSVDNSNMSKAAESKKVKLEVSRIVILSLKK